MLYRFGTYEFDSAAGELRRAGHAIPLERQPALALARLLEANGDLVTRDQLKAAIWPEGTHVDFERGLAYCVSQVRSALGDSGENPRFVQTLPRKGYRFIAPVEHTDQQPPVPSNSALPRPRRLWMLVAAACVLAASLWAYTASKPTIVAVTIFDNETGLPEHDRIVSGLADLVVARVSELAPGRIAVIGNLPILRQPRNIRNLPQIKATIDADYVILGQLQRGESGFRFVTHLIRLSDGTHLKANRIQFPGGDVQGLEPAVVAEFERAVRTHLLP